MRQKYREKRMILKSIGVIVGYRWREQGRKRDTGRDRGGKMEK